MAAARERGLQVLPHGVSLSLGGADRPDRRRLDRLASVAERTGAPLVSEHIAFVRAGGRESGHLLPVPRTREALEILVENVALARDALPVPLALEHVAALVEWPGAEMDEAAFVGELLERTGALLLLDLSNLYANAHNHGYDALDALVPYPLGRIAYVQSAAGRSATASITTPTRTPSCPASCASSRSSSRPSTPRACCWSATTTLRLSRSSPPSWARSQTRCGGAVSAVPPADDARASLAARQAALLEALLRGSGYPQGFCAVNAGTAGRSLRRKRARAVARAWPALATALGDRLEARFDEFERTDDAPRTGDPLRDGLAFAGWLRRTGAQHGEDVRVEVLLARAALARGGLFVGVARLRRPHRGCSSSCGCHAVASSAAACVSATEARMDGWRALWVLRPSRFADERQRREPPGPPTRRSVRHARSNRAPLLHTP